MHNNIYTLFTMRNYLKKIISKVYNISHCIYSINNYYLNIEQKTYSSLSLQTIVYTIPFIRFLSAKFFVTPCIYEGRNIKNIPK